MFAAYVLIKIFHCQHGRNGRKSRIDLYSPNHPDRWSLTVTDAMSSVPIWPFGPWPIVTGHMGTTLKSERSEGRTI